MCCRFFYQFNIIWEMEKTFWNNSWPRKINEIKWFQLDKTSTRAAFMSKLLVMGRGASWIDRKLKWFCCSIFLYFRKLYWNAQIIVNIGATKIQLAQIFFFWHGTRTKVRVHYLGIAHVLGSLECAVPLWGRLHDQKCPGSYGTFLNTSLS